MQFEGDVGFCAGPDARGVQLCSDAAGGYSVGNICIASLLPFSFASDLIRESWPTPWQHASNLEVRAKDTRDDSLVVCSCHSGPRASASPSRTCSSLRVHFWPRKTTLTPSGSSRPSIGFLCKTYRGTWDGEVKDSVEGQGLHSARARWKKRARRSSRHLV